MGEKKFSLLIITGEKQPDIEISSAKRAILQGVVKPKVWRQCWGCKKYMEEGKLNVGTVAPQVEPTGEVLTGGADQILVPQDYDPNWRDPGYRRRLK